jgi:hypothetical protein
MKYNKYLSMAAAGLLLASCADLDTLPMGSYLTEDQRADVIKDMPEQMEASVTAIFGNLYGWELITENMYDFGFPANILTLESRSQDFVSTINSYGWFEASAKYQDNLATSGYGLCLWGVMYNVIYTSNQIVEMVDADSDDDTTRFYLAQAFGARAFAYYQLAQVFQFNYSVNPEAPCVPLITNENSLECALNGAPRATVKAVYAQILSDLDKAVELLTDNSMTRTDKRMVDLGVVYGLRARANLAMHNYANAAADAQMAIQSTSAKPLSVAEAGVPGFNELDLNNWMWGIPISEDDAHGLYTYIGFMGSFNYGYAYAGMWKMINNQLWEAIPADDVRKGWWIDPETRSSIAKNYSAMYYSYSASLYLEAVGAPDYAVVKFAPYKDELLSSLGACDVPLMRVEEMYLIYAEALAMSGKPAEGKAAVESFVNNYRWLGDEAFAVEGASAEEVQEAVLLQRRIELWGEGFSYIDCMRLNRGIDRRGTNFNAEIRFNIPAGSPVLLYQIPNSEMEGNPALTDADQNPTGDASL